ncbi:MAG: DUF4258 domain-containing protein [Chloroflexota bacterium]|nr:DUF4258 domain-containing protein [Chloroflexota bacterium]MDE2841001.1 DUF4258 domain-containing protein [Chloroflexota bacterium]MDE2929865.1 DUF4258 domain-containing protein [Chloroflexota bacterium]
MKPIRLTRHARERCLARGATEDEVIRAIRIGVREPAKLRREMCRLDVPFESNWQGTYYSTKQVAAVIIEEPDVTVVVTVYTRYF